MWLRSFAVVFWQKLPELAAQWQTPISSWVGVLCGAVVPVGTARRRCVVSHGRTVIKRTLATKLCERYRLFPKILFASQAKVLLAL